MNDKCVFCKKNRFCLNEKIGLDPRKAILYEDENIYVTPDLAPLEVGHLLIVSREHFNSFVNAPTHVKISLINALKYFSEEIFAEVGITWFEHGAVFEGTGGASIDHAHLHIIPRELELNKMVEREKKYSRKIPCSQKEFIDFSFIQPYLWVGDSLGSYLYCVNKIPSQYLRNKVMSILGSSNYNWKENYYSKSSIKKYKDTIDLIMKRGKS